MCIKVKALALCIQCSYQKDSIKLLLGVQDCSQSPCWLKVALETTSACLFTCMEVFYWSDKGQQKIQDRDSAFCGDNIRCSKWWRGFRQSGLWGTRGWPWGSHSIFFDFESYKGRKAHGEHHVKKWWGVGLQWPKCVQEQERRCFWRSMRSFLGNHRHQCMKSLQFYKWEPCVPRNTSVSDIENEIR